MALVQIFKLRKKLVVDDRVVFDPAHLALRRAHFGEALAMLHHFQRFPVGHQSNAVRDSRHPVMQIDLPRRNINIRVLFMAESRAAPEGSSKIGSSMAGSKSHAETGRTETEKAPLEERASSEESSVDTRDRNLARG